MLSVHVKQVVSPTPPPEVNFFLRARTRVLCKTYLTLYFHFVRKVNRDVVGSLVVLLSDGFLLYHGGNLSPIFSDAPKSS